MKKISFAVAAFALVSLMATSAAAQNMVIGKADVPFSFTAHNRTLPAAQYVARQLGAQVLRLEDVTTHEGVTLVGAFDAPSKVSKLIFHKYGEQTFLASVESVIGSVTVPKSAEEKSAARKSRESEIATLLK